MDFRVYHCCKERLHRQPCVRATNCTLVRQNFLKTMMCTMGENKTEKTSQGKRPLSKNLLGVLLKYFFI